MVDADVVEVIIALPGQLFFNTQIPACLWFLAKQKKRKGEVLFIDARKLARMISRVQCEFTVEVIERIAGTVAAWRGRESTLDAQLILRLFLIILGVVFLILSFAGAILALARRADRREALGANPLEGITKLVEALKALFDALAAAPLWLGLGGFVMVLILLGTLLPIEL